MIERQRISKDDGPERAILVGVCTKGMDFEQAKEYLDELAFLAESAGAKTVRSFLQRLDKPVNATYIGTGKVAELKEALETHEANLVIFDDDLSPSQIRNLDKELGVKVLDRSSLILYIFSERAQTAQARAQVDLAQYKYLLPRLAGMWTHLERQKGGIGLKGAGEKEIETDRRIIRNKISQLQQDLIKIDRQDAQRRKNRSQFVRVALVGYTNVGKSTLMNRLAKADVQAEDKLFATLDTTVRKVALEGIPFLLSDTVGFIRKLPTHLVESFKGTLAEAKESDILLHVVDISHPNHQSQIDNVQETLHSLDIEDRTVVTILNKADLLSEEEKGHIREGWLAKHHHPAILVSAGTGEGVDEFRNLLVDMLVKEYESRAYDGQTHPFLEQHQYYRLE
ncbi:MAG: GTPase HflX [Bacteroidia bacterium]|nr:GTPase HflX [Bacteroidia bacterium]